MAQDFVVNGNTITRLVRAEWQDSPGNDDSLAGYTPLARVRRLTLSTEVLGVSEYNTLSALQGQRVSVVAPDYEDRNGASYKTYYAAVFENLTGQHDGPNLVNVQAEFSVRI